MPVSVTVGKESYRHTFTVAGDTVRIVAWDTTVMTLPKDDWLNVVAAMAAVYRPELIEKALSWGHQYEPRKDTDA